MRNKFLFTSESVTEGHPDKVCDIISDSILDAILSQDNNARVACETMITTARVFVSAEITTTAEVDYDPIIIKALDASLKKIPSFNSSIDEIESGKMTL